MLIVLLYWDYEVQVQVYGGRVVPTNTFEIILKLKINLENEIKLNIK